MRILYESEVENGKRTSGDTFAPELVNTCRGFPLGSPVSMSTPLFQPGAGHAGHTGRDGSSTAWVVAMKPEWDNEHEKRKKVSAAGRVHTHFYM